VFDYLSKEDRERIEHAAASLHPPASESESTPAPVEDRPTSSSIPHTAPHIASAALKGFMPFTNDLAKQERYVAYLRSQSMPEAPELLPPKLPGQTSEVYYKELSDYSKSAAIFKPVSGAMASRFTTAADVDVGPKAVEGLHQPAHEPEPTAPPQKEEKEREKERGRPEEEEQSSKAHAARTGMYGALTREVVAWQPSRLLCKRFGVKDPNPDITTDTPMPGVTNAGTGGNTSTWKAEEALAEADLQTANGSSADAAPSSAGRRTARNLENIGLGEDDSQGRDTLTYVRPSMDIFKAIFASDDENSDEDGEGGDQDQGKENAAAAAAAASGPDPLAGPSTLPTRKRPEERPAESVTGARAAVPAHLRADGNADEHAHTYEPKRAVQLSGGMESVDLATFKPVFVPRGERETQKSRDKKEGRKDKDKKKAKAVVSFEDGEDAALVIAPKAEKDKEKARRKKKRRKEEKGNAEGEEDVEMWVEKPPPAVVASFSGNALPPPTESKGEAQIVVPTPALAPALASPPDPSTRERDVAEGPPRGRKRAIDFL